MVTALELKHIWCQRLSRWDIRVETA